jgi:hypothetical protein
MNLPVHRKTGMPWQRLLIIYDFIDEAEVE